MGYGIVKKEGIPPAEVAAPLTMTVTILNTALPALLQIAVPAAAPAKFVRFRIHTVTTPILISSGHAKLKVRSNTGSSTNSVRKVATEGSLLITA